MKNERGEVLTNYVWIHHAEYCDEPDCPLKKLHGHHVAYMILEDGREIGYDEQFHRFLTDREMENVL